MGEKKKGKALALELIDDLLKDNKKEKSEEFEIGKQEPEKDLELQFDSQDRAGHTTVVPSAQTTVMPSPKMAQKKDDDKTMPVPTDSDQTERINESLIARPPPQTRERASVGRANPFRSGGQATSTEAALAQSESLRIAQNRLLELEQEIERLRLQNEELAAAGETLRRRSDELLAANQRRESDYENAVSTFEQEKGILTQSKEAIQRDMEAVRQKNEELELRISTNIQKIRVRERELENRLELVKMENAALVRSKDDMILELKRQIDQINLELTNYRSKNQELNRQGMDKQEMLRRTVKALRLALSMLEGEEDAPKVAVQQRKAK